MSLLRVVVRIAVFGGLAAGLTAPASAAGATLRFTDLGANLTAAGVNDAGQVAMNQVYLRSGDPPALGVLWDHGQVTPLRGLSPGEGSYAADISPAGRVVGNAYDSNGPAAVFWQGSATPERVAGFTDNSTALAVNAVGDLSGTYVASRGTFTGPRQRAFVATAGGSTTEVGRPDAPSDASDPGGQNWDSRASGIDDAGEVLGSIVHGSGPETGTYEWPGPGQHGRRLPFDTVIAMGNDGEILGTSQLPEGSSQSHVLQLRRLDGTIVDLCVSGPACGVTSVQNGMVVGRRTLGSAMAPALWRDGTWTDLTSLLPAGWTNVSPADISPNGTIVGSGTFAGATHAFLLQLIDPLDISLKPHVIGSNDVFDLTLHAANTGLPGEPVVQGLTFGTGNGVDQQDGAPGTARLGLTPFLGPSPGYPSSLAPGDATDHVLAYAVEAPGTAELVADARGTDAAGTAYEDRSAVRVAASYTVPDRQAMDGLVAGGLTTLLDQASTTRDRLAKRLSDVIHKKIAKGRHTSALLKPTSFEQALARRFALPKDALSWIPNRVASVGRPSQHKPSRTDVALAFLQGSSQEMAAVARETADRSLVVPFEFWRDFLFEPAPGARAKMTLEMARLAHDGVTTGKDYLGTAASFYTTPALMQSAWTELPRLHDELSAKLAAYDQAVSAGIVKWDDLMKTDPVAGAKQFGRALGRVEGEVAAFWVENLVGGTVTDGLKTFVEARKAAGVRSAVSDVAETTQGIAAAEAAATPLAATKALGNLTDAQVGRFQQIVQFINDKFGVDIELQARPINEYAQRVLGGIGKVEAVPTKNLTPDDVLLGAPAKWLGQTAYYKPTLPANLKKLSADTQERLTLRAAEKGEEMEQFLHPAKDPRGKAAKVHKALQPGGDTFTLGKNGKVLMELEKTVDDSGAILIRYKRLDVNGRAVFTGKPRPIVSDVDFNALVDRVTGRALPAGIRGQIELEVMRQFAKAAEDGVFPFGYHGWTHSGFDVAARDFRYILKYQLMYLSKADAAKLAAKYAKIYGVKPEEFLDGYTKGKFVVKITADDAVLGSGAH